MLVAVSTRSVAVTPSPSLPLSLKPTTSGIEHRDWLAEHGGFCFDAAHAPAQHAKAVDHGGVAVGADAGIGIGDRRAARVLRGPDGLRDILEVHLMADAGARRHCVEIGERLGPPLEEIIAFEIALVFDLDVLLEGLGVAELVDHDRMVDHEVDRDLRIDPRGVAAQRLDRIAHRGKIDHAGHAGEILKQHPGRAILDFRAGYGVLLPVGNRLDVGCRDGEAAILETQQVFEQDLHRKRQARNVAHGFGGLRQGVISVVLAAHVHRGAGAERVLSDLGHGLRAFRSRWSLQADPAGADCCNAENRDSVAAPMRVRGRLVKSAAGLRPFPDVPPSSCRSRSALRPPQSPRRPARRT